MNHRADAALRFAAQSRASVRAALWRALALLVSPGVLAAAALLAGCALLITGVHTLWGHGWALIAGAVPALVVGGVLLRGVIHGG